jgi:hypothetical protein
MTLRSCRVCNGWHDIDEPWPNDCLGHFVRYDQARSETHQFPMFIPDHMPAVQSMLDGKMYDSKSELRKTYKAAGVIEVGNDAKMTVSPPKKPKITRDEIERAVQMVKDGYKPVALDTTSADVGDSGFVDTYDPSTEPLQPNELIGEL